MRWIEQSNRDKRTSIVVRLTTTASKYDCFSFVLSKVKLICYDENGDDKRSYIYICVGASTSIRMKNITRWEAALVLMEMPPVKKYYVKHDWWKWSTGKQESCWHGSVENTLEYSERTRDNGKTRAMSRRRADGKQITRQVMLLRWRQQSEIKLVAVFRFPSGRWRCLIDQDRWEK